MSAPASPLLLLNDIDEPGLATLEVYERRGGYESLRRALQMTPQEVLTELEASGLRGRGGAGFAMGKKVSFLPKGSMDKYLVCNADESEPGTFKDRELMQKTPHMLIEGIVIASYAAGATRSFIYIRGEYVAQADALDAALSRSSRGRLRRPGHPRLRARPDAGRAPRRRRLHLRRGDGPARLARGQARQPSPEAPLSGQPGPLPGAHAHQQRGDPLHRPRHHADGRRAVRAARGGDLHRDEAGVGVRARAAARKLRDRAGDPSAGDHLRARRRTPAGPRGEVLVPGRILLPRAHRRRPGRPLRLRLARQGRVDARLGSDHRRRRHHADPRRGDEGGEVLPARVVRQVHPLPGGDQLDGQDARADRVRGGHADGPRDHGLGPGAHHRQLPVRAGRRDGDADRLDDRQVPRGVRSGTSRRPGPAAAPRKGGA